MYFLYREITKKIELNYHQILHLNPFMPSIPKNGLANSVDPDQMPQNVVSDQGLPVCFNTLHAG